MQNKLTLIAIFIFFVLVPRYGFTSDGKTDENTFDQAINLALQNASVNEHSFIEEQLINLNKLSAVEKQRLRAFIMDIALRQSDDVHDLNLEWQKQKTDHALENALYELYGGKAKYTKKSRVQSEDVERAMNEPLRNVKEVIKQITFDINNNKPLEIKVSQSMVSQIIFFDASGEPFEIIDMANGNEEAFSLDIKTATKNVISIDVNKLFTVSNASVYLKGINIPIILRIVASIDENTTRLMVRLKQRSPDTKITYSGQSKIAQDDQYLDVFVSGKLPIGARIMAHDQDSLMTDVYLFENHIYVVTPYKILSPGAVDSKTTPMVGMNNVYKLKKTSNFLLSVAMNSKPVIINLSHEVFDVAGSLEKKL